jgi:pimeloyl-ACP methyl ester carboxylesterase
MKKLQEKGQRVLVVHGEADTSCLFRLAEEMRDTFPNVELHAVPHRGHVDIVWGRATETLGLIEKEIRAGDSRWVPS